MLNLAVRNTGKLIREKSKIVWAKFKEKMPIIKSYCIKAYKFIKAQTIKLCLFIKAKTPVVCNFIKEKSIVIYNEIKKNPKQGIVAGVIFLFAILLIVFRILHHKDFCNMRYALHHFQRHLFQYTGLYQHSRQKEDWLK